MSKLFGSPSSGAGAAAAQRQAEEAAREARISEGLASINDSFSGFNNDFFNQRTQAYNAYYLPQLSDQLEEGRENLTTQLARSGLLKSTAANEAFADLQQQYDLQRGSILNRAETDRADFQSQVNANRNQLIGQLQANANPEIAASQALNASQSLRDSAPQFSPLASVLTPAVTAGANFLNADRDRELLNGPALSGTSPRSTTGVKTIR